MKTGVVRLFGCVLWLMPWVSNAAPSAEALQQRAQLEILAYRATTEFSLLSVNGGTSQVNDRLDTVLRDGSVLAQQLVREWPLLKSEWDASADFIQHQRQVATNGDSSGLPARLKARQEALYAAFDIARPPSNGYHGEQALFMALLDNLEKVTAAYVTFATGAVVGQSLQNTGIERYSSRIFEILGKMADSPAKERIRLKWMYVKNALMAYDKKPAVFIVESTLRSIRDITEQELGLRQLASQ
ncbi:hypothetical protein ACQUQU_09285 [Thalassolituus sp. LLYu03]|uniref:hypothetical protein n=1 Tax=Thalassolituus sp. LLYu03 TaxID=3421656 RepID=UPI003D29B834